MTLNLKTLNILVVEDLAPMRKLIIELLSAMDVGQVIGAKDGQEAYRVYLEVKPDIIFTDWEMPGMDGLNLIRKIRQADDSHNKSIPIIMLSGFGSRSRITEARDCGVTEFLTKPFTAEDIAKRLNHVIKNPRDFIFLPDFIGPDRRRTDAPNHPDNTRQKETRKKIKANTDLIEKAGVETVDESTIEKSQEILDQNEIDFPPIAIGFLNQLHNTLNKARNDSADQSNGYLLEDLTLPIMQLKANARIFKYDLVGNLADILLAFLENVNEIDSVILEILESQRQTLSHLVNNGLDGTVGKTGEDFETEVKALCNRYMKARAKKQQTQLQKVSQNK
ncbi:MAG: response regulator [Alphaproteobacteria bacterium]